MNVQPAVELLNLEFKTISEINYSCVSPKQESGVFGVDNVRKTF